MDEGIRWTVAELARIGHECRNGFVYLFQDDFVSPPAVKIGRSTDPVGRFRQVCRYNRHASLVADIPNGHRESSVHAMFDHLRITNQPWVGREWFKDPHGEIRAWFLSQPNVRKYAAAKAAS
jgi:hypothetical protein